MSQQKPTNNSVRPKVWENTEDSGVHSRLSGLHAREPEMAQVGREDVRSFRDESRRLRDEARRQAWEEEAREEARNEARKYLNGIYKLHDEAHKAVDEAHEEARSLQKEAREEARKLREAASEEAHKLREKALEEAREEASKLREKVLEKASEEGNRLREKFLEKAIEEANKLREKVLEKVNEEAHQLREKVLEEASKLREKAVEETRETREKVLEMAIEEAQTIREKAVEETRETREKVLVKANEEVDRLREQNASHNTNLAPSQHDPHIETEDLAPVEQEAWFNDDADEDFAPTEHDLNDDVDEDFAPIEQEVSLNDDADEDLAPTEQNSRLKHGQWMEMYQRLVEYKRKYKHTRVPRKFKEDPKLGTWVNTQRYTCKQKHRIDLLGAIGFEWNIDKISWMEMYQRLVEYKQKYKHTRVPCRFKEDPELAMWVRSQRSHCKRKDRIDLLDAIGFEWRTAESTWMDMYQRLVEYKRKYKNTQVPRKFKEDPKFGTWVHSQRGHCKRKDRMDLLDALGFEFYDRRPDNSSNTEPHLSADSITPI